MKWAAVLHRRVTRDAPRGPAERCLFASLVPLGWLFGMIGKARAAMYRRGILRSWRVGIPVISVGNLSVGGTGKTPLVDYLLKFYLSRGVRVAVVSRGYGGRRKRSVETVSAGEGPLLGPEVCGDEPYLLALRNPEALVFVAPRRIEGVRAAEEHNAQVIVLDDGFQHLAVRRDLDIVLLDGLRPFGNGLPLPAGNLREFPSALSRGDLLILTRWPGQGEETQIDHDLGANVLRSRHVLGNHARSLSGEEVLLDRLAGKRILAFAGIAHPENFFGDLGEKGLNPERTLSFPDHACYSKEEVRTLADACQGMDLLLTTEKDGVKLVSADFSLPCFQVPLEIELQERKILEEKLLSLLEV